MDPMRSSPGTDGEGGIVDHGDGLTSLAAAGLAAAELEHDSPVKGSGATAVYLDGNSAAKGLDSAADLDKDSPFNDDRLGKDPGTAAVLPAISLFDDDRLGKVPRTAAELAPISLFDDDRVGKDPGTAAELAAISPFDDGRLANSVGAAAGLEGDTPATDPGAGAAKLDCFGPAKGPGTSAELDAGGLAMDAVTSSAMSVVEAAAPRKELSSSAGSSASVVETLGSLLSRSLAEASPGAVGGRGGAGREDEGDKRERRGSKGEGGGGGQTF